MTVYSGPTWDQYCSDEKVAGPFENKILYFMCRKNLKHESDYVTAGKITAIGRIYAAAPERGAGAGRSPNTSLARAIGVALKTSTLDSALDDIPFSKRFSDDLKKQVVGIHSYLVDKIVEITRDWSGAVDVEGWEPRVQSSFASKYLHFHRPNAFPIMDSYARAGLICAAHKKNYFTRAFSKTVLSNYDGFCTGFIQHVGYIPTDWTPRSTDTLLVADGREHKDPRFLQCPCCNYKHRKRRPKETPPS